MHNLFDDNALKDHLLNFEPDFAPTVSKIQDRITSLRAELSSGKIKSLKESEIKSRFLNGIFDDILGFKSSGAHEWYLSEEVKSRTDGTRCDGALGYFSHEQELPDVRAVIEAKASNAILDDKQKRPDEKRTPIEQGFSYAPKHGPSCQWVIVTNLLELRFYRSNNSTKFEPFTLESLGDPSVLKKFIFLFHKDRFIRRHGQSPTDLLLQRQAVASKSIRRHEHIVDQLYYGLRRFDGFSFIDPNYLCRIFPFNIFNRAVWHYSRRVLHTNNPEIYSLLKEIQLTDGETKIKAAVKKKLAGKVTDEKTKLDWVFQFLARCMIQEIHAIRDYKEIEQRNAKTVGFSTNHMFSFDEGEDGIVFKLSTKEVENCECQSCRFHSLDFDNFIRDIKSKSGNIDNHDLEHAYGHYLVSSNNYATTFYTLKNLASKTKGRNDLVIEYFLVRKNTSVLHNLIQLHYSLDDRGQILQYINQVDMDDVLYNEIEFYVDADVRRYLKQINDGSLSRKTQDSVRELADEIEARRLKVENGTSYPSGPRDDEGKLFDTYFIYHAHCNLNFIIADAFSDYEDITFQFIRGMLASYRTKKYGIKSLNLFALQEAIIHIEPSKLESLTKEIDTIALSTQHLQAFLERFETFLKARTRKQIFGTVSNRVTTEYAQYYAFNDKMNRLFSNHFILLRKLEIQWHDLEDMNEALFENLRFEDEYNWWTLEHLGKFLEAKGEVLKFEFLSELLSLVIGRSYNVGHKYHSLIQSICRSMARNHPGKVIKNRHLARKASVNFVRDDGITVKHQPLIPLLNVFDVSSSEKITSVLEEFLDMNFSWQVYRELLVSTDYDFDNKDYFKQYANYVEVANKVEKKGEHGSIPHFGMSFFNFVIAVCIRDIDRSHPALQVFKNLMPADEWLLRPKTFNYDIFDVEWLRDIIGTAILDGLRGNRHIRKALVVALKKEYDPVLAELRHTVFK